MLLHDILTISFYFGFIFGYLQEIGTLVIVIHDLTDVPIAFAKAINTTIYEPFAIYPFLFS